MLRHGVDQYFAFGGQKKTAHTGGLGENADGFFGESKV
jgi:hypothetical protein